MCSLKETVSGRETATKSADAALAGSEITDVPGDLDAESHPDNQMIAKDDTNTRKCIRIGYVKTQWILSQAGKTGIDRAGIWHVTLGVLLT